MKNIINYYYNFNIDNIYQVNDIYYFTHLNKKYILKYYDKDIETLYRIYNLNNVLMVNNNFFHRIVINNSNLPYIVVNDKIYVLLELTNLVNDKISIYDIIFKKVNVSKEISPLITADWYNLWIKKIDYLEYKMEHIDTEKTIMPIYYFFIGLSENAVSLVKNSDGKTKNSTDDLCISHRRVDIDMNLIDYYLPLDLVIDHKSRDIAEYIKSSIVKNRFDYNLFNEYLDYANLSDYGYTMLMGRILFPSFFFDNLENIDYLLSININKYIEYLKDVYYIIKKRSNIDEISWLKK